MTAEPVGQEEPTLKVAYKEASVSVRGLAVFLLIGILGIIGSNLYSGLRVENAVVTAITRIEDQTTKEHRGLQTAQNRTSCIMTMNAVQQEKFRSEYAPGAFPKWCPWVVEDSGVK